MRRFSPAVAATLFAITVGHGGAASAQVPVEPPLGPVMAIAHRGASFFAPEHTLFAYDLALAFDVDMIECDLQLARDDVLVCVHDTTVNRTSNGTGRIDSFTIAELRQLDFGSWFNAANPSRAKPEYVGAKIVTFEEQLWCYLRHNPRMRFHAETKAPVEYGGRMEPALVSLLTRLSLRIVKSLAPTLPTVFLFSAPTDPLIAAGSLPDYVDAAAPTSAYLRADPAYVASVHKSSKEVHTWTVDSTIDMDYLLDIGIDGIFSNRADLLRERIDARGAGVESSARGNPTEFPRLCRFPPDLTVGEIRISPEKVVGGDQVTFSATIANAGTAVAEDIRVRFNVDGAVVGTDRTIGVLAGGASTTVTSDPWYAKHQTRLHTVEVGVDPDNTIAETNEANNAAGQTFAVQGNKLQ